MKIFLLLSPWRAFREWRERAPYRYYERRLRFWLPAGAARYAANRMEYLNESISRTIALAETRRKYRLPEWEPKNNGEKA